GVERVGLGEELERGLVVGLLVQGEGARRERARAVLRRALRRLREGRRRREDVRSPHRERDEDRDEGAHVPPARIRPALRGRKPDTRSCDSSWSTTSPSTST